MTMKIVFKGTSFNVLVAILGALISVRAADSTDTNVLNPFVAAKTNAANFKDNREKASYGVGVYYATMCTNQLKRANLDVDLDVVVAAFKDLLSGGQVKLDPNQSREAITSY